MTSRKRPGVLFTLVGPAGAGKNRLMKYVLERTPLRQLPTATTRAIRTDEQEGREHLYVSTEAFQRMIDTGELLEHQIIHEKLYGMPLAAVEAALDSGEAIVADIEVLGASRAQTAYPDNVVCVFIEPPSIGILIERMRERNESNAEIGKRLLRVPMELAYAPECDYVILNDDFDQAAQRLYEIVTKELYREPQDEHLAVVEAGQPHSYTFAYVVRIVPIFGAETLQCDSDVPSAQFNPDELPHSAALRLLHDTLGVEVREDALIYGDQPDGSYLPPLSLDYTDDGSERITYTYGYKLAARLAPRDGWRWTSLSETPLIAALQNAALEGDGRP